MSYGRSHTRVSRIVTVTVLLALSAFFSSSETAIFSLPAEWFERQAATDDPRAQVLKELYDDPHRLLVTLLVGNNVVNIAISSIVTVLVASYLPSGAAVAVATVCTSFRPRVRRDRPQGVRPRKRRAVVAADRIPDPTGRARPPRRSSRCSTDHPSDERVHQRRREYREAVHGLTRTEPSRSFDRPLDGRTTETGVRGSRRSEGFCPRAVTPDMSDAVPDPKPFRYDAPRSSPVRSDGFGTRSARRISATRSRYR